MRACELYQSVKTSWDTFQSGSKQLIVDCKTKHIHKRGISDELRNGSWHANKERLKWNSDGPKKKKKKKKKKNDYIATRHVEYPDRYFFLFVHENTVDSRYLELAYFE